MNRAPPVSGARARIIAAPGAQRAPESKMDHMATFFCRLNPPRLTFASDMTADEASLMQEHGEYWHRGRTSGNVKAFGLVADLNGAYGIGIVEFLDEAEARTFTVNDPVIRAERGFHYDVSPMPLGVAV